jgi:hypothetical protein
MSDEQTDRAVEGEEFLEAFRRGMDFTRELLHENERLRRRLADLEQERREGQACAHRCAEIEQENDHLASLCVASAQLHSTLDLAEVIRTITEIAINLIGADRFAIYALDERRGELRPLAAEGVPLAQLPACRVGEGRIGAVVAAGAAQTFEASPGGAGADRAGEPLAVIPLRVEERSLGAIAIFRLLPQKPGLSALDHELFEVLAGHAATAIFAARLHAQSERKLSTIQGFLDLLSR